MFKINVANLVPSPLNPRTDFSGVDEIGRSMLAHKQFTPLVVRPIASDRFGVSAPVSNEGLDGEMFEVICGHTRLKAAQAYNIAELDCVVRLYTDEEAVQVMALENLQRTNLNPIEEALAYQSLILKGGRTIEDIARERVTDVRTITDRMRLLRLIEPLKEMLLANLLPVDYALELAKLPETHQQDAFEDGLWRFSRDVGEEDAALPLAMAQNGDVLKSLPELKVWIRQRVAFDAVPEEDLPLLFPQAAAVLEGAKLRDEKVLYVSYDRHLSASITEGRDRVRMPGTWRQADGHDRSEPCEYAQPAVVPGGTNRGRALLVCVAHRKCRVHWKDRIEATERKKAQASAPEKVVAPAGPTKAELERRRWVAAKAPLLEALRAAVVKLPTNPLRKVAIDYLHVGRTLKEHKLEASDSSDILRAVLLQDVENHNSDYDAAHNLKHLCKQYGVNAAKIVAAANGEHEPRKPRAKRKAKKVAAKGARR